MTLERVRRVSLVCVRSPGATGPDGLYYARDSILLLDEFATTAPGEFNQGLGWTVPTLAENIATYRSDRGCAARGELPMMRFLRRRDREPGRLQPSFGASVSTSSGRRRATGSVAGRRCAPCWPMRAAMPWWVPIRRGELGVSLLRGMT